MLQLSLSDTNRAATLNLFANIKICISLVFLLYFGCISIIFHLSDTNRAATLNLFANIIICFSLEFLLYFTYIPIIFHLSDTNRAATLNLFANIKNFISLEFLLYFTCTARLLNFFSIIKLSNLYFQLLYCLQFFFFFC